MHKITHPIAAFFSRINHVKNSRNFPFVILLSIIAYEVMKINLQVIFKEFHNNASLFDNSWALSSVIGSTLLGFLSDRFFKLSWRKPICLIGMGCSLITGLVFLHPILHDSSNTVWILFFVLLNGLSGSYIGAARAFYLDQSHTKKVRRFAITVVFQCIPWVFIGLLLAEQWINTGFLRYFSTSLMAITLGANILFAGDNRKPQFESIHGNAELKELAYKYNRLRDWSIIVPFFILAISYHLMPYLGEYAFPDELFYQEVTLLGFGVGIGVPIAFLFRKLPILRALKIGYAICLFYFLLLGFLYWANLIDSEKTLKYQFLIFAILGGTLWILSLKEFLIKSKLTEDGLVLGIIESIQSLGEFAGAGLSTLISSSILLKKEIDIKLFSILLGAALFIVSLESILKGIKKIRKQLK